MRTGLDIGTRIGVALGIGGPRGSSGLLIWFGGDSNAVGQGTDQADPQFDIFNATEGVQIDSRTAPGVADPPVFESLTGATRPRPGGSGVPIFGYEITLARTLRDAGADAMIIKGAINGAAAREFAVGAGYPTVGPDLIDQELTRIIDLQTSTGREIAGMAWNLGTNDASTAELAAAYQARMVAIFAHCRTVLGAPTLPMFLVRTHASTANPHTATVIAAQNAIAAADANVHLIIIDDVPFNAGDGLHLLSDGYLTVGERIGIKAIDVLGFARRTVTVPTIVGVGPASRGADALSPLSSALAEDGDLEILAVTTGLVDNPIAAPAGWTQHAVITSTFSTLVQHVSVFSRAVTQAMIDANDGRTAPTTIADTNNFNASKIYTIRGAGPLTVDAVATAANNAFDAALTLPSVDTSATGALILRIVGAYSGGANQATITAGNETDTTTRRADYLILSDHQILAVRNGRLAATGPTGTATVAMTGNAVICGVTLAVRQ